MFVGNYDWQAIRDFYEVGHTRAECQRKFGFSNGAWCRAVERGEITPRPKSSGDGTDNRLGNLEMLCGNCHAQTDTYGGRNGHRRGVHARGDG